MRPALGRLARATFDYALRAVAPAELIKSSLKVDAASQTLRVSSRGSALRSYDLRKHPNILILGAGKASQELCHGILSVLSDPAISAAPTIRALINIPEGQKVLPNFQVCDRLPIHGFCAGSSVRLFF